MNKKWWNNAVVYQIYPRSFCDSNHDGIGDIGGMTGKLEYLRLLGIDIIWLSPVYESPNDDGGYDISDYQAIQKDFGTMKEFDDFLEKAHKLGIKIMMDLVVNHTSDEHLWFKNSRKGKDNPYHDYYIWKDPDKDGNPPNHWESTFSGSAWKYEESVGQFYLHSFSPKQPDLNWDNPKVRQEVYDMIDWWCRKGVDGFRLDVISMISKDPAMADGEILPSGYTCNTSCNGPKIHDYLKEMNERVFSRYPLITVGECPGVDVEKAKQYASLKGDELDMIFQFDNVSATTTKPNHYGKWDSEAMTMPELRETFSRWQTGLEGYAWNSLFQSNHDQPRCVSRFGDDSEEYREISAKMLATMIHFQKGTPYIYQGEELGMTNAGMDKIEDYRDIESLNIYEELTVQKHFPKETVMDYLKKIGRDNARTPMQWNSDSYAGFSDCEPWIAVNPNYIDINAEKAIADPNSIFYYYKKLIELRHTEPVMVEGVYEVLLPDHPKIYAYTRTLGHEQLLILCNYSKEDSALPCEIMEKIEQASEILIHNYEGELLDKMRSYEAIVYRICN